MEEESKPQERPARLAAGFLLALAMVACSANGHDPENADAGESAADANIADQAPPIRYEQTGVFVSHGQPVEVSNYRTHLKHCEASGFPVTPLPADVADKLGHIYRKVWMDGVRMSVRQERWELVPGDDSAGACQFKAKHSSKMVINGPDGIVRVDLDKKTAIHSEGHGVVRHALRMPTAADDDMKAKVLADLRSKGYGGAIADSESASTYAGQPCKRVHTKAFGEICVWSGGRKWGFTDEQSSVSEDPDVPVDSVVLVATPADGHGMKWTTTSMSVGTNIDDDVFEMPSGISVAGD